MFPSHLWLGVISSVTSVFGLKCTTSHPQIVKRLTSDNPTQHSTASVQINSHLVSSSTMDHGHPDGEPTSTGGHPPLCYLTTGRLVELSQDEVAVLYPSLRCMRFGPKPDPSHPPIRLAPILPRGSTIVVAPIHAHEKHTQIADHYRPKYIPMWVHDLMHQI